MHSPYSEPWVFQAEEGPSREQGFRDVARYFLPPVYLLQVYQPPDEQRYFLPLGVEHYFPGRAASPGFALAGFSPARGFREPCTEHLLLFAGTAAVLKSAGLTVAAIGGFPWLAVALSCGLLRAISTCCVCAATGGI